jgi:serine/threonine protein kinase
MNVARSAAMNELWTRWEGELINARFPLRRFLSASDHSGVFLTEHRAQGFPNAAIKIVPADPASAEKLLSRWRAAAALSHPHLIRLFDSGRCQLGDRQFIFVVMEYAEENLSEILPSRALSPDEVRELLIPMLDALAFLHRKNLVQGHVKPSNILVVDDQPKLASDTICPAGESAISRSSIYDPPESKNGTTSAASDIWALGITIVEALTQRAPAGPVAPSETLSLPSSLPPKFVDAVRRCLSRNPADRPTAAELQAKPEEAPQAPVDSIPQSEVRKTAVRATPPKISPIRRSPLQAIGVLLIVLVALWVGLRLIRSNPNSQQSTASSPQSSVEQAASAVASSSANSAESKQATPPRVFRQSGPRSLTDASSIVLHEEIPDVPLSASHTIRGRFNVTVLVTVDRAGNVVDQNLRNFGPSAYFARLATSAARKWKFAPADDQESRECLLSFEFTRGGVTAHATLPRS